MTLVGPPTLIPVDITNAEVSYDLDAVLPASDVVMMLRVQHERMSASYFPSAREYSRRYGMDGAACAGCRSTRSSCTPVR